MEADAYRIARNKAAREAEAAAARRELYGVEEAEAYERAHGMATTTSHSASASAQQAQKQLQLFLQL